MSLHKENNDADDDDNDDEKLALAGKDYAARGKKCCHDRWLFNSSCRLIL